jgi:hypothetical protein
MKPFEKVQVYVSKDIPVGLYYRVVVHPAPWPHDIEGEKLADEHALFIESAPQAALDRAKEADEQL